MRLKTQLLGIGAVALVSFSSANAALIGETPGFPLVEFGNLTQTAIAFSPDTRVFALSATPSALVTSASDPGTIIGAPSGLQIQISVDQNGTLTSGTGGFTLQGTFVGTINGTPLNVSGILLSGDVLRFGWDVNTTVGYWDFDIGITGGALANYMPVADFGLFASGTTTTFTGSFGSAFDGQAEGIAGASGSIAYTSSGGAPPQQTVTVTVPPDSGTAAGVTATLANNAASGGSDKTVTAVAYTGNPVAGDSAFGAGGSASASFLDLKVTAAAPSDSLTSQFYYPDTGAPVPPALMYYTGTAWVPVLSDSSPPNPPSSPPATPVTVDGKRLLEYTVVFDATSTPEITQLTGTVFALDQLTAPVLSCQNLQVNPDTGLCSATLAFTQPVAGFPSPTITYSLNGVPITSPYTFPLGVSTVFCTATSSQGSDSCVFTVNVVELKPVAGANAMGTYQGQAASVPVAKVLVRDSAPSGGTLSIVGVESPTPNGATVTLSSGRITYTPTSGFIGQDTITYDLTDGCGTVPGTIVVTVLAASLPAANSITIITTSANTTVVFAGIPGATYAVQWAPAISGPWTDLSQLTAAANGLIQYTDTTFPKPTERFYRTRYITKP